MVGIMLSFSRMCGRLYMAWGWPAGMLHTLGRGLRFAGKTLLVLALALGVLPLMFGVLCDLVLAPFRCRTRP